jgi:RecT family
MADEPIDEVPPAEEVSEPAKTEPPQPMDGNGKTDTITDAVRRSRESIPSGDRGIEPKAYEHYVVLAKDAVKAHEMLPVHMRGNVAVMTAIARFTARFDLEPVMFASQTYMVPGSDRLSFTSQAFGAILYASKLLRGRLQYEYRGEGDEMTCTVRGRFKDDPDAVYSATTPTLKQIRPPRNDKGVVKGSPLYDKDPEQQLGYYAQRRWMRRFTPDVCMGMFTREEMEELDEYRRERGDAVPLTADRLGQIETGEGWGGGEHVDLDLAAIAPEEPEPELEPEPEPEPPPQGTDRYYRVPPKAPPKPPRPAPRKAVQARKPAGRAKAPPAPKGRPGRPGRPRGRPLTRPVVQAVVKRAENPPRRAVAQAPKWLDYVTRADAWIKAATNPEKAEYQ